MKLHPHHRARWLALALVIATTFALAAQAPPDEDAGSRLSLIPHASAAPPPEPPVEPTPKAGQRIKVLSYNAYGAVRTPRSERVCRQVGGPMTQRVECGPEKVGEWKQIFDGVDGHQFRFVDVLAERIAAERPQLVGLQEMCGSQVNHLEWALASRGYPMVAYFDEHTKATNEMRCPTNEGRWPSRSLGKAILVQGQATPAAPGGFDARGIPQVDVCVHWQGPMTIRFCSVHTGPDRIPAVASGVNGWARAEAVLVVGDFNAEPADAVMDTMYEGGDEDPRGRGSFSEADTFFTGDPGPWSRYERCGERTNRGLIPEKIDYVFLDAEHFEKPAGPAARDANWCGGDAKTEPALTPPRAWVEDTEGQCGGEACSDHQMLWAEVSLRVEHLGASVALAGLWLGVGDDSTEPVHELNVLRIRADGSINDRSLYEYADYTADGELSYYSGQLVDRGGGRYTATLRHNLWDIDPMHLQVEVVDCATPRTRFAMCVRHTETGPIELYVRGDYGYEDMYHRLQCGGAEAPPDLPPQADPYARPCD